MRNLLLVIIAIVFMGCSTNTTVAGGSDLPNGIISGVVVTSTGTPTVDATAKLIAISVTDRGDSTISEQVVSTNSSGEYEFSDVANGSYILTVKTEDDELAIRSRILKGDDTLQVDNIHTREGVTIRGRLLYDQVKPNSVIIPGVTSSDVTVDGFYTLNNVPVGDIEIMSLGDSKMSVLSITVESSFEMDTASIRDCRFGVETSNYSTHSSTFEMSSIAFPEIYDDSSTPSWYEGVKFGGVNYDNSSSDDLRPLWHFPVIVEVSPATIDALGLFDNVTSKVRTQFNRANEFFSGSEFDGRVHFAVDSIGVVATPSTEFLKAPESSYALRIVYDFGNEVNVKAHDDFAERTFVLNNKMGTLFGAECDTQLFEILARSRGALRLNETGIQDYNNSVSNKTFAQNDLLMWGEMGRNLSEQTIGIINKNSSSYTVVQVSAELSPSIYKIKLMSDTGVVIGAEIKAYGVDSKADSLNASPRYHGVTNLDGVFTFDENPYVLANELTQYRNYLIEIVTDEGTGKQYYWMPYYDAVGAYLATEDDTYTVTFTM